MKFSPIWKYMTDSRAAAAVCQMFENAKIPYQIYHNSSDVRGGQTLGNISTAHVSVPGVDIGLPQLAMHSAMEVCGVDDIVWMTEFFARYFMGKRDVGATTDELEMW